MNTPPAAGFAAMIAARAGPGAGPPPALLARAQAAFGIDGFCALLAPPDADTVAGVLALCSDEGWPVIPVGAATWLGRAPGPDGVSHGTRRPPPVLLSTIRLDRVTEHEPADLVIGVQAGLSLARLHQTLVSKEQWLPLDPASAPDATIGATASLAAAGPLRAAHGTPRDMALGLEIATGDGRLLRFGGRVVKNVAGYDGVRLAVGSGGRLGVITALYLRVRGAPRADRTLAVSCGLDPDAGRRGANLAMAVRDTVACDALELISPAVARSISTDPAAGWLLLVRMLGGEAAVAEAVERARRIAAGGAVVATGKTAAGPAATGVTGVAGAAGAAGVAGAARVAELPSTIWTALMRLEADATTALRLTGPPTMLERAIHAAATLQIAPGGGQGEAGWMIGAHAADGVVRMWRSGREPLPEDRLELLRRFGEPGAIDGWTVRYDHDAAGAAVPWDRSGRKARAATTGEEDAIGAAGQDPGRTGGVDVVRNLTQRLRSVFDPEGIMYGGAER